MNGLVVRSAEPILKKLREFPFAFGFTTGLTTALGIYLYSRWNFNLSPLINLGDIYFSMKPSRLSLTDESITEINSIREAHAALPMGPVVPVKSRMEVLVSSRSSGTIPLKIYVPNTAGPRCPVIVYIHGGGFVVGNTTMYEPIITFIAEKTRSIVVGVDYRKAPEHKFPTGAEDCIDAVQWVHANAEFIGGDPNRLAVVGDSAGGNLSIIVSLELHDIITIAVPIYPVITFGLMNQSKLRNAFAPILKAISMDWYNMRYFSAMTDILHPLANPLVRSQKELSRVPYTHVITAEYDVLMDEGIAYVNALKEAGAHRVTYQNYDNTVHGFFGSRLLTHGLKAMEDVCEIFNGHFYAQ